MIEKVILLIVSVILFLILLFFLIAVLRRIKSARRYKELDRARAYYLPIIQEGLEKGDIISITNNLISEPGSIKFKAIEELLFKMKERFPELSKELFIRLGYVSFYEKKLDDKNRLNKAIAIDRLGLIGLETSVGRLSQMLKAGDREIISVTVRALSNIGTLEALALILEHLPGLFERWLITRKSVETALLKFGDKGTALLIQYGRTISNPKITAIILDTLSHLNNNQAIRFAMDNLGNSDPEVRAKSLKVIERFSDLLNGTDIEKILSLSKDPAWFVRLHVARILGKVNGKRDVMGYLEKLVIDENWRVRNEAASALSKMGVASLDLILKILKGKDQYAIESLCEEIERTELCRVLIYNLTNPDRQFYNKSREILKIMHNLGFSAPLMEYLQTGDEAITKELKLLLSEKAA